MSSVISRQLVHLRRCRAAVLRNELIELGQCEVVGGLAETGGVAVDVAGDLVLRSRRRLAGGFVGIGAIADARLPARLAMFFSSNKTG